ncbi:MAG: hypothetical protein KGL16_07865, partial [Acidobacteriota bacterium]|nr:hypothetical protein [Acidobacteriota bacterium]
RTPQGQMHVVLTNVGAGAKTVAVQAGGASGPATVEALRSAAGRLRASAGISLAGQSLSPQTGELTGRLSATTVKRSAGAYHVTVAPASAAIVSYRG